MVARSITEDQIIVNKIIRMNIYQNPQIEILNLKPENIGSSVLCTSVSVAETEGFHEYELITDEE